MVKNPNKVSLIIQEKMLKKIFPDSIVKRNMENYLIWTHTLTPSHLSDSYKVKLYYAHTTGVKFYVTEPKLKLAVGKKQLPHTYSTEEQRLCLYYPDRREWNANMLYVKTIIPWACEWLYYYEIWAGTGEWYGGGVDHINRKNSNLNSD